MSEFNINEDAQSGGECSGSQSSTNNDPPSQTTESAFPDEDEETITMVDVLEREDKLEEEASAVLGNSDEKNCTYPKGYVPRQALYSCATCYEASGKLAAVCLACSLECHDNHELFELYTKRNYRCDCGNSKFNADFECKLIDKQIKKAPLNEMNRYNHNFTGKYCVCDKHYPPDENDDSAESSDEMWQCIACEDWFHTKHLEADGEPSKFEELICGLCVKKLDFVHHYKNHVDINDVHDDDNLTTPSATDIKSGGSEVIKTGASGQEKQINGSTYHQDSTVVSPSTTSDAKASNDASTIVSESDTNDSQMENKDPTKVKLDTVGGPSKTTSSPEQSSCVLEKLKKIFNDNEAESSSKKSEAEKRPLFWSDCSWRSKLCRCAKCMSMYREKDCEYLLDEKDTVQYYEAQGRAISKNRGTPFERGMTALNGMNRTAVVEALHGYDELKADLSSYLKKFVDTKKVVREEDIHDFFAQLRSKKRPRLEYE